MNGVRKFLAVFSALLLSAAGVLFTPPVAQSQNLMHRVGQLYYASGYSGWQATVLSGNTTTGAGVSVVIYTGPGAVETLADGATIAMQSVFNTSTPILINDANAEVVTPTGVSFGGCPAGNLGVGGSATCATVTGTFNNTHGQGAIVTSGDSGIAEAITDAGANGGGLVFWSVDTGIVTLNTGGLTTTTTTKVPTNFYNAGASGRVTTTITTTTNWAIGISGATGIFCSANATLTAGTTCVANQVAPASTGTTATLTALLITTTVANPGAGAVKLRVWGWTPVQAAS